MDYYAEAAKTKDEFLLAKIDALQKHPEFKVMMDDIKAQPESMNQYFTNEYMMMKLSKFMGGLPEEIEPELRAVTFHMACKSGDIAAVKAHLDAGGSMSDEDENG